MLKSRYLTRKTLSAHARGNPHAKRALAVFDNHRKQGRRVEVLRRGALFSVRAYDSQGEYVTHNFGSID